MYYYGHTKRNKPTSILDLPASERPREKLKSLGASGLSNTELLAVLLCSNKYTGSVLDTAARVLALEPESIAGLCNYAPEEFMNIRGMGEVNALRLCAAIELGRRIASAGPQEKLRIDCPKAAADAFMEELRHQKAEVFMSALLNVKNELIMKDVISRGAISSSYANPREVFANPIKKGAYAIILLHNHPSGDPTPSTSDINTTKVLAESGKLLGIQIQDHIIIGDGCYYSFAEEGKI